MSTEAQQTVAERLREQAQWCQRLGSPLYERLLTEAATDCERGGPTWSVLAGHEADALASAALALRFMGAVHRLVLERSVPDLASYYPSAGGVRGDDGVWGCFRGVLAQHCERLRALVALPVQTNEVGRSASLLGGFLTIARETSLPLRLLELGASAGLNLHWDHYRYESGRAAFGDPASPVRFTDVFEGSAPELGITVSVHGRAGCDTTPIDLCSEAGRVRLRAYVWPDQRDRHARLEAAIRVAATAPVSIDGVDARDWLEARLRDPVAGVATVVFHTIVIQYLGRDGARRIGEIITGAGLAASPRAPLAWLRLEPTMGADGQWEYRLVLTTWPAGQERILAISSPHGPPVRWLGP
jgi:hypothetical protein